MRLKEWVDKQPRGVMTRLMVETGLAYTTVLRAVNGKAVSAATARTLSAATGGEVSAASIAFPEMAGAA